MATSTASAHSSSADSVSIHLRQSRKQRHRYLATACQLLARKIKIGVDATILLEEWRASDRELPHWLVDSEVKKAVAGLKTRVAETRRAKDARRTDNRLCALSNLAKRLEAAATAEI